GRPHVPLSLSFSLHRGDRHLPSFPTRRSSDLFAEEVGMDEAHAAEATFCGAQTANIREHQTRRSSDDDVLDVPDARNQDADLASERKSTRLNSSHVNSSYAVFCLKKKMAMIEV